MRYLESLGERPVGVSSEAAVRLQHFDTPMPEHGRPPMEVLRDLDEFGSPATVAQAGPRYFGFVIGGALPATVAASWMATAWDQNSALVVHSPVAAHLEEVVQGWLLDVLQLPGGSGVGYTTCATTANFSGLAAARHAMLAKHGWDVEAKGLIGAPPIRVVTGDEVHASVLKALMLVGLGKDNIRRVPADSQGRFRVDQIGPIDDHTIICAQVGNVNSGASDPVGEIADIAHARGAWVHVDGAFGLWAAASPALADQVRGVDRADSWALDAHKWLNVPYDSGVVISRDREALRASMTVTAPYLVDGGEREPCHYVPDFSRRARGIEMWAALSSLGRDGLVNLLERCCEYARMFADGLRKAGYEVLNDVVLNQVVVVFGDEARTREVVDLIQKDGTCWCGSTTWQGRFAMRISVSSWATAAADVERSLAAMVRIASAKRS